MIAWEEEAPLNRAGEAAALTTLAWIPRRLWFLKLKFWLRRLMGPPHELIDLSFIYYARTAIFSGYGGRDYLYFESNFNGRFDAYIDAFSYVVPRLMRRIWSEAEAFPGPQPATPFKQYIRERDFPAAHYYAAYGHVTVTEVTSALALRDRVKPLERAHSHLTAHEFAKRWYALWTPARTRRPLLPRLAVRRDTNVARGGCTYGLTVLHAIRDGHVGALNDAFAAVDDPFAKLEETHFARFVVLDRFPFEAPPHLLFSAVFDGDPDAYLERLCREAAVLVDGIWVHCADAPGSNEPAAFARWIRKGQQKTSTFFAPYGKETRRDVEDALRLRQVVEQLAYEQHYGTPRALYDAFRERVIEGG